MIPPTPIKKSKFTKLIEEAVLKKKMSYMDAALHICEENHIEPEDVRKYISPVIKSKIEAEAMELYFLPRVATLPGV